jgi:deoxyguanosine kinase
MNIAFLSLGGNVGNRVANLDTAVRDIESICGRIVRRSSVYETEAWGYKSKLPYLNMVVKLQTALSSKELLEKLLLIEKKLGRVRTANRNADRVIDLDILFYNKASRKVKNLRIPHPRLHLRKFVLVPLNEIAHSFVHPTLGKSVGALLKECGDQLPVKKYIPRKGPAFISIEGNIGAGKTTLATELSAKTKGVFMAEEFARNSLLPLFYDDPKRYAFPLEFSFLLGRFELIKKTALKKQELLISDFCFHRSLWFAKVNLKKKEFEVFRNYFNLLEEQLPQPDLLVYIHTSADNLKNNIEKRARYYERKIKKSYLKKIEKQYLKGVKKAACKVLVLNVESYSPGMNKKLMDIIEKFSKDNFG